jgi:ATP-dependent helicase/nuclease subunit A
MTVHGAKGLEADIVILPDTTAIPQSSGKHGALLYTEDGVLFPLSDTLAPENVVAAKGKADAEALAEHRRLLYVALTRARDRLHICGFEGKRGVRSGSWYELMQEAAKSLGVPVTHGDVIVQAIGVADMEPSEEIERADERVVMPAWVAKPAPAEHERPRLIRPSEAAGLEAPAVHSPGGDTARFERGLLVHTLLAKLPELKPEAQRDAAHKFLARKGLAPDAAAALIDETLAVIENPAFAAAFTPYARAEAAIVADLPELGADARISGRIDRLAVRDDEVLAIDFKTNRPPPKNLADVPRLYLSQMALYRAALAKVFPGKRIVCALLWTDGPTLMPIPDAMLEAEMGLIGTRLDPRQACS